MMFPDTSIRKLEAVPCSTPI
jgi:hypothetical protein